MTAVTAPCPTCGHHDREDGLCREELACGCRDHFHLYAVSPVPSVRMLDPMVDWIGNFPVAHGERGRDLDPKDPEACLCGHPVYWMCSGPGIEALTVQADVNGGVTVDDGWVDPGGRAAQEGEA